MRHARIRAVAEHQDRLILRRLFIAIGWALVGVILWLSLTPQPPHVDFESSDKVGHFIAYGSVMFWFCQIYRGTRSRIAYAAGFIAMGIAIEFLQRATGYRSFEVMDMVADAIGVLLGWAAALALPRLLK
jgi:VanZ family protein